MQIPRKQTQMTYQGGTAPAAGQRPGGTVTMPATQGGTVVQGQQPTATATAKKPLTWQDENKNLRGKLGQHQVGSPEYNRIVQRINFNREKAGLKARGQDFFTGLAAQPQAPTATAQAAAPAATALTPEQAAQDSAAQEAKNKIMFPDTNPYAIGEDWKNSPVYQMRLDQGQKNLTKLLASRGLAASGNEISQNVDLVNTLTNEEANRAYDLRGQEIANNLTRGASFQNYLTNEADRKERIGAGLRGDYLSLLGIMAGQNPMGYAADMTGAQLSDMAQYNQGKASSTASGYGRVPAATQQVPGYVGPAPTKDTYGSQAAGIFGDASTNNQWINALGNLGLGGLMAYGL